MYKLVFFVPVNSADIVKAAVFSAGAGQYENYEQCAWEVLGTGQFKPVNAATPTLGELNQIERVDELRVECLCPDKKIHEVINALKQAHPYEAPAFEAWRVEFHGCEGVE